MNAKLTQTFEENVIPLAARMVAINWEDSEVYAAWLSQTYYFVLNSTRLLSLAGALFTQKDNAFHSRFVAHASEEIHHETLALQDIKKLGHSIQSLPEAAVTASFWQSQVYWSLYRGPLSFLGYIFCLEGLAVKAGHALHAKMKTHHGPGASNFIRVHAEEDEDHLDKAFALVENASQAEIDAICENMIQCCSLYGRMLDHCEQRSQRRAAA